MSPTPTKATGCPGACAGLICLPPISDDMQLIWTQAELTSDLDNHPQLLHTFSYFPYPSMPEIVHLSLRFGLQIGKVKTWFMVQRIRCCISWSPEEIEETRSRLLYNQDQLHFKPLVALSKKSSAFHSPGKLDAHTSNSESRQDDAPPPLLPSTDDAAPEAKKPKTEYLASEVDQERSNVFFPKLQIQSPVGFRNHSDTYGQHSPDSNVCAEVLKSAARTPTLSHMFGVDGTAVTPEAARLQSEEEHGNRMETPSWNTDGLRSAQGHEQGGAFREDGSTPVTRRQRKTKEQLAILKSFFLKCQWACREDYKKLEEMTGLPRPEIIQWFGDTRYALKHGQLKWFRENAQVLPSWLDDSQHQVTQNGRQVDPKHEEDSGTGIATSVIANSETDLKPTVQPITASALLTPVLKTLAASTNVSEPPVAKAPEKLDDKSLASSETTKLMSTEEPAQEMLDNCPSKNNSHAAGQVSPIAFQAAPKSPCGPSSPIPAMSPKKGYAVLERHWSVQRHIKEDDLQLLVTKSGLSRKEVKDWFCHKSDEPAEVEVCLDEEEEEDDDARGEMEEDDDDVVIQD